jgi:predicted RNA-binding Zn-ribbon protein involved in translation (DUF1610 family)
LKGLVDCPSCGAKNTVLEWNRATEEKEIEKRNGTHVNEKSTTTKLFQKGYRISLHTCPSCQKEIVGRELELSHLVQVEDRY